MAAFYIRHEITGIPYPKIFGTKLLTGETFSIAELGFSFNWGDLQFYGDNLYFNVDTDLQFISQTSRTPSKVDALDWNTADGLAVVGETLYLIDGNGRYQTYDSATDTVGDMKLLI
ncbi:MAG: hypothetical protein AAF903_11670 [Pseudomonadota bacterium]